MKDISLSVVIPAYNEEKRILRALTRIDKYLSKNLIKFEIIVVSDGSIDNTAEIVTDFAKHHRNVRLIELHENQGKGAAVKKGVLAAGKDWILVTDTDLSTPIEELPQLVSRSGKYQIIYGSRYLDKNKLLVKQPLLRQVIGRFGNFIIRIFFGLKMVDTQCGFKLFDGKIVKKLFRNAQIDRWGWDIEILVIGNLLGLSIVEVPVSWRHDKGSRFRAVSGLSETFKEVLIIRNNVKRGVYANRS